MNEVQLCLYHHMKRYMEANGMTMYTIRKQNPFPIGMENIRMFVSACDKREDFSLSNKMMSKMLDFFNIKHYVDSFDVLKLIAVKDSTTMKRVEFRMTEKEHSRLTDTAQRKGMSMSEFVRIAVLNEIKVSK